MKIYIDNYHYMPNKLNMDILKDHFKHDIITCTEFYTDNGVYTLEKNDLYKLTPTDKPLETIMIEGLKCIVDKSYYTKKTHYQLSPEHVVTNKMHYIFHNSKMKIVVEGNITSNDNNFTPSNFYFETHSDNQLNDPMVLNEFNEFLSTFN